MFLIFLSWVMDISRVHLFETTEDYRKFEFFHPSSKVTTLLEWLCDIGLYQYPYLHYIYIHGLRTFYPAVK